MRRTHRIVVGVMGPGARDARTARLARQVGRLVAGRGAVLLCGGRGGAMEAAARGAREAGGLVVGVLPGAGPDDSPPNRYVDVAIFTGMRDGRNWINVCSCDAVVAILPGGDGTLSEIALARKLGRPVVLLAPPELSTGDLLPGVERAETAVEAVARAFELLR